MLISTNTKEFRFFEVIQILIWFFGTIFGFPYLTWGKFCLTFISSLLLDALYALGEDLLYFIGR